MLEVGLRVVRGPDWKWGLQDDGEGHCGTVVEIGKPGSATSPDKTVVVQWDSGSRTNYRVGYQGSFDLRVVDNAPAGVKHPNIICDGCKKQGIAGMRWKCVRCYDYDLCTHCYMAEKHDLSHLFQRFETASSLGFVGLYKIMERLSDLIDEFKAGPLGSSILLVNGLVYRDDFKDSTIEDVNESLEWMCRQYQDVKFMDPNERISMWEAARDGIHLNRRGGLFLGQLIVEKVQAIMQSEN